MLDLKTLSQRLPKQLTIHGDFHHDARTDAYDRRFNNNQHKRETSEQQPQLDQHFPWTYDYCPYHMTDNDDGAREIPCYEIVDGNGRRVAMTDEDTPPDLQEADARLLASAPSLLQALTIARIQLGRYRDFDGAAKLHALIIIDRALAAAKGDAA